MAAASQPAMSMWEEKLDPASGRPYYVNRDTRESRWDCPADFDDAGGAAAGDVGDDFFTSVSVEERLALEGDGYAGARKRWGFKANARGHAPFIDADQVEVLERAGGLMHWVALPDILAAANDRLSVVYRRRR